MAIRLRKTQDGWVALCAAENKREDGDIYLDDNLDRALRIKFKADYISEGYDSDQAAANIKNGYLCPKCYKNPHACEHEQD